MKKLPTYTQLIQNFLNCINWEEKYMYIIDLGKLLPMFPKHLKIKKYLIPDCQSQTWIALTSSNIRSITNKKDSLVYIQFDGDSDAAIVKGIIAIIFSIYQDLNIQEIITLDIKKFLYQLNLQKHLTFSRSQGMFSILDSIQTQSNFLYKNRLN